MFNALDQKEKEYKEQAEKIKDTAEIFDFFKKTENEMRNMIDGIFDVPVCDSVFENVSVYALSDGLPLWVNLMLAIMDEMNVSVMNEQKRMNPRVAEYMKKYKK